MTDIFGACFLAGENTGTDRGNRECALAITILNPVYKQEASTCVSIQYDVVCLQYTRIELHGITIEYNQQEVAGTYMYDEKAFEFLFSLQEKQSKAFQEEAILAAQS